MGPDNLVTAATLPITPELVTALERESHALEEAQDFSITDQQTAVMVNGHLIEVKRRQKVVEEWDDRFAQPIRQLEATRRSFFGPAKTALANAESYCKNLLKDWTNREAKRIADERARADAVARQLREEAERKAAAERARAEEAARKAREEAAAAEAERQRQEEAARQARENGDRKGAADAERKAQAAAAEAAKKQAEERQRQEDGERKAQEIQLAAAAAPVPEVQGQMKLAGTNSAKNWIAELAPNTTDAQAQELIVKAIAGLAPDAKLARPDLLVLIPLDMKWAKKIAKSLEHRFNVPGLTARDDRTMRTTTRG